MSLTWIERIRGEEKRKGEPSIQSPTKCQEQKKLHLSLSLAVYVWNKEMIACIPIRCYFSILSLVILFSCPPSRSKYTVVGTGHLCCWDLLGVAMDLFSKWPECPLMVCGISGVPLCLPENDSGEWSLAAYCFSGIFYRSQMVVLICREIFGWCN